MNNLLSFLPLLLLLFTSVQAQKIGNSLSEALIERYQPTIDAMTNKGWDHSNSIILHAMEKIHVNENNPIYVSYIQNFVDTHVSADGDITGLKTELDGIHPGILCLFLYEQTGEEKYKKAARNMKEFLVGSKSNPSPFNKTPDGGYWHKNNDHYENVMTIDGAYMANPFLLKYGTIFNDQDAINIATFQTLLVARHTFNITSNLPYHGWDYSKLHSWSNPITGTSPEVWSRSIGWFSMALVDMLEYLPEDHKDYKPLLFLF